jgi:hypothetical protein
VNKAWLPTLDEIKPIAEIKKKIDECTAQSQKLYFNEEGSFNVDGGLFILVCLPW